VIANTGYEVDEEAVKSELNARWEKLCGTCKFVFQNIKMPVIEAEYQGVPWEIEPNERLPKGSFSEKLWVIKGASDRRLYWITGKMQIQKKVPVSIRSLEPGKKLSKEDFDWQWRDTTFSTDGVLTEQTLIGQVVRYALVSGDIIWARAVQREKAVKRGEIVKVYMGQGNWQVTMQARTEQDGYVGDIVTVKNLKTNKLISGEVVGPNEVALK
jgi:flagella basal body P-ring formation protein FlgA